MKTAKVKYQVGTYSGEIDVPRGEDDDNEVVEAKARKILEQRSGPLPFGYHSFKVQKTDY